MQQDLTQRGQPWPHPKADSPLVTPEERERAQEQWSQRVCATYVSVGESVAIYQQLLSLGAPLDVLTGCSYVVDEMTRHLALSVHTARPMQRAENLSLDESLVPTPQVPPTWEETFCRVLEFFGFNLALTIPVYEAIGAATSDTAIADLARAQIDSYAEMVGFGQALLVWMSEHLPARQTALAQSRLPGLLSAYESLMRGSPEMLDQLAGQEISVETRAGNLGSLDDAHLAAIFYHTLNASIFPVLDNLGWEGFEAWRRHYRHADHGEIQSACVASVAVDSKRQLNS